MSGVSLFSCAGEKPTDVISLRCLVCDKTEDCLYKVYHSSFSEFREFLRNSLVLLIFPVRLVFLITHHKDENNDNRLFSKLAKFGTVHCQIAND